MSQGQPGGWRESVLSHEADGECFVVKIWSTLSIPGPVMNDQPVRLLSLPKRRGGAEVIV